MDANQSAYWAAWLYQLFRRTAVQTRTTTLRGHQQCFGQKNKNSQLTTTFSSSQNRMPDLSEVSNFATFVMKVETLMDLALRRPGWQYGVVALP